MKKKKIDESFTEAPDKNVRQSHLPDHLDEKIKNSLHEDMLKYLCLREEYEKDKSVETYNSMRRCIEKLSDLMLLEKASSGSVQAVIEMSKINRSIPNISTKSDLAKVHGITSEQLRCELKKMDLTEITPILDDNGDVTVESVKKAFFSGQLTYDQYKKVLYTFKLFKDSKPMAEVDSVINVTFNDDIKDALIDGIKE